MDIQGDAIALRELVPADAAAAFMWAGDRRFFEYMTGEPVASVAEEAALLRAWDAEARAVPRRQYRLGIVERDTSTLIGIVRLGIVNPEQREADLGYGLRHDRWGRGIAVSAARLLIDVAFADLRLHRVFAYHDPHNRASRRVMEKLGMTYEGTLRENMLGRDGWRDSAVWSVLEGEWRGGH